MGLVESKINHVFELIKKGEKVKMKRAEGVFEIKDIETKNNVIIVKFVDNIALFLTGEQFLNREIFIEKNKKIKYTATEVVNMVKTMKEYMEKGWKVYYKGKQITSIDNKEEYAIISTIDGTIYMPTRKEFLESYKTARWE